MFPDDEEFVGDDEFDPDAVDPVGADDDIDTSTNGQSDSVEIAGDWDDGTDPDSEGEGEEIDVLAGLSDEVKEKAKREMNGESVDPPDSESDSEPDDSSGAEISSGAEVDMSVIGDNLCELSGVDTKTAAILRDNGFDDFDGIAEATPVVLSQECGVETSDAVKMIEDARESVGEYSIDRDAQIMSSWTAARNTYTDASSSDPTTTKADAREKVLTALRTEAEFMSVRDRSDEENDDLWVWRKGPDGDVSWDEAGYDFVAERMVEELGTCITKREIKHCKDQLSLANRIDEEELNAGDQDRMLIPVSNGIIDISDIQYDPDSMTIDIESVEVSDHHPNYHFTYCADAGWYPEDADLEGVKEWLKEIMPRDADRRVFAEIAGHSLHPGYPIDCFAVLLGRGGSGKSMAIKVLKQMLGEDCTASVSLNQLETNKFIGSHVVDKNLNTSTELSGTALDDIESLKTYSAGETDFIEEKRVSGWFATNSATMLFASDNPPAFPDDNRNKALGRRLYPIEFPRSYEEDPDPDNPHELQYRPKPIVEEELQQEGRLQGMLILAVEGLKRILEEGKFTPERDWEERIRRYETFSDPIRSMVRACLRPSPGKSVESADLEQTYDSWAEMNDEEGKSMKQIANVLSKMTEMPSGSDRTRDFTAGSDRDTVYKGVTFTEDALRAWVPEDSLHRYCDPDELFDRGDGDDGDDDDGDSGEESGPEEGEQLEEVIQAVARKVESEVHDDDGGEIGLTIEVEERLNALGAGDVDIEFIESCLSGDGGEDQDGDGGDRVMRVGDVVLDFVKEMGDTDEYEEGVPEDDVVEFMSDEYDVGREDVERGIKDLKKDGELYEPKTDYYRGT